uniref:PDZ domain-containing protein n=1 Tax=Strigamia maritima TaxID=126957 RepID=T1JDS9_STRMM
MAGIFSLVAVVVVVLLAVVRDVRADECFTSADIAGSVLGTFFSTLAAVAIAGLIYWFVCRPKRAKSTFLRPKNGDIEAHAYDNPYFQDEDQEKPIIKIETKAENGTANPEVGKSPPNKKQNLESNDGKAGKKTKNNKSKPFTSVFSNNKPHTIQRALDDSCIQQEPEKLEVCLRGCDFTGLGFNICGNIRHGIYVRDVLHRGPASESGKIKAGDRILGVTVCFDKITIEDALTILSYASPYDVTLYIQKTSEQSAAPFLPGHQKRGSTSSSVSGTGMGTGGADVLSHPVYRSQSNDDVSQLSRETANNKRSLSVGVVGPRVKVGSGGVTQRVQPIKESDVAAQNKTNKETVVSVEVNEVQKEAVNSNNPFVVNQAENRRLSTQTSTAFIPPHDLTIEIPTFGLSEGTSGVSKEVEVPPVLGPCVIPADSPHAVHEVDAGNGPRVEIPDARRTFIRELTSEDSLKNFDIPAMDLDDVQLSLDAAMKGAKENFEASSPRPDLSSIKQTIVRKLSQENLLSEDLELEKTVILPRVDLKTPSAADFERDNNRKSSSDDSLDENINYFESKMQKVLANSPKLKPKRNSNAGKRRAPQPPSTSQPSSPIEDGHTVGNPFVKGIPSQASLTSLEQNHTKAVVFLKPNNVTSVQVNSGSTSPEPKSPKRSRAEVAGNYLAMSSVMKTNFDEGLDKASGDERFNSIPRTGLIPSGPGSDKAASSRRTASLDDLTKIEDSKPLPLERAVSMDMNNADELSVDQLEESDKSSDQQLFSTYFTKSSQEEAKEKIEIASDLEKWVKENLDKSKIEKYFEKQNEVNNDVTLIAVPLHRTSSMSSSTLSEDSIENEQLIPKRHMLSIDPSIKTYDDSESDQEIATTTASADNLRPSSGLLSISPARSPTITIPIIPPIINTRELSRTPSPNKDLRIKVQHEENGERNGSTSGYDISNDHRDNVTVTTMHVTVKNDGKSSTGDMDAYSVTSQSGQTVLAKTVFISGPQLAMPSVDDSGLESPPPNLQPPQ